MSSTKPNCVSASVIATAPPTRNMVFHGPCCSASFHVSRAEPAIIRRADREEQEHHRRRHDPDRQGARAPRPAAGCEAAQRIPASGRQREEHHHRREHEQHAPLVRPHRPELRAFGAKERLAARHLADLRPHEHPQHGVEGDEQRDEDRHADRHPLEEPELPPGELLEQRHGDGVVRHAHDRRRATGDRRVERPERDERGEVRSLSAGGRSGQRPGCGARGTCRSESSSRPWRHRTRTSR